MRASVAIGRYGNETQYAYTVAMTCEYPTSDTRDIIGFALRALESICRDGNRCAKAGVTLEDFYQSVVAQLGVFSQ
ncbi:DinB/UmuC family translesion DNA polymerase [Pantoea septica]|uniref:DinB/UmuC family translesion DNA polymerase n=1 Tax=Pantoea septica TaxID=472695 RepID=UPI0035E3CF4B